MRELGIKGENIHVKYHHNHESIPLANHIKQDALNRLLKEANMKFTILESHHATINLLPDFDLVILGITSGIYEAVFLGIPLVVFGRFTRRAGGLREFKLPCATSGSELLKILEEYDSEKVANTYLQIANSLQSGVTLEESLNVR